MMPPRARSLTLVLCLAAAAAAAACASRPFPAPASQRGPALAPCARIAALQRAALDAAHLAPADLEQGGACLRTPAGAWGLVISHLRHRCVGSAAKNNPACASQMPELYGRVAVVHVGRDGQTGRFTLATGLTGGQGEENFALVDGNVRVIVALAAVFDYDGDGEPEVVVTGVVAHHEGSTHERGWILTARGGVREYAPARGLGFHGAEDLDHDGRPDLLTYGPYTFATEAAGSGFDYIATGPVLALHARPDGTFAAGDQVAAAYARRACPSRPQELVARRDESAFFDAQVTGQNVVCARLHGVAAAEILAAAAALEREGCGRAAPDGRERCLAVIAETTGIMRAFAGAPPPLQLR